MSIDLGHWALIDLETSGLDPIYDSIIDVGFLQFEGTKLTRRYQSLVRFPMTEDRHNNYSHYIQKLTGITPEMLRHAPLWSHVLPEVESLAACKLVAHNAGFEESFLNAYFKQLTTADRPDFVDSLPYLALVFLARSSLSLESFILDFDLRKRESHRGLDDSVDLLKVMLMAAFHLHQRPIFRQSLLTELLRAGLSDEFFAKWFSLTLADLNEVAEQIELDMEKAYDYYLGHQNKTFENSPISSKTSRYSATFSGENIKKILQDEAQVQKALPNYHYRPSQEELALRVGQSFKNKVHALIQAPTGTGKTMGYLLPSILFSLNEGEKVLVATGTKALQHQAMHKDIPEMRQLLNIGEDKLKVTQVIGSNNHLCELLYRQEAEQDSLLFRSRSFEEKYAQIYYDLVFLYNVDQKYDEKVVRGDIPYVLKKQFPAIGEWEEKVAVDYRSCTGQRCPFKGTCSYLTGLIEARDSHVIVGNHALMFTWPKGVPRPLYVIVDEAHKIEGEATRAYALEVSENQFKGMEKLLNSSQGLGPLFYLLGSLNDGDSEKNAETVGKLRTTASDTARMLADHLAPLSENVGLLFNKMPRYTPEYWNELAFDGKIFDTDPLGQSIKFHLESLKNILHHFLMTLSPYIIRFRENLPASDQGISAFTKFETFYSTILDAHQTLEESLDLSPEKNVCRSLWYVEREGFKLGIAPVDVGRLIHEQLLTPAQSVVFTSATLANEKGDQGPQGIEWATGYAYLEPAKRFRGGLYLPPVFNYADNTKIFFCDDLVDIHNDQFAAKAMEFIIPLVRELSGGSLLLFSSRKRFEAAREILLEQLEGELPIFIQGMGNSVVEDFKNAGRGVLLGMETFGEGIDVPGKALQFLFVDKIPDLRQDLVTDRRRKFFDRQFGNEFSDYYLAHRARSLHQKLGRLLRSKNDVGSALIVDSRIKGWKPATTEKMFKLMSPYKIERRPFKVACEEIRSFLEMPRTEWS
ncbi:MAG: DEAD/DEAH box helicase family protein [Bdellovibrio sp.]|nr:DEAD/DEAH box helicase family protein [Bdellovibrio sp.]